MQLFSNTAAALPAELGSDGKAVERRSAARRFRMLNPTRAALAWHKRVTAQRERRQVQNLLPQEDPKMLMYLRRRHKFCQSLICGRLCGCDMAEWHAS